MKKRLAFLLAIFCPLGISVFASLAHGQAGGDIEGALRRAVDQINLKIQKLGPSSAPSAEQWQEMQKTGWIPPQVGPLKSSARFSAQAGARHMNAGISISITRADTADDAFAFLQNVTDHRKTQLAAGKKPFGGWSGKIELVDYQGCRASRAALIDKSFDENDPSRTEWLSWIQGPLLVEFVVNSRAKEPDFGLKGAAYSLWKELEKEGFSCGKK